MAHKNSKGLPSDLRRPEAYVKVSDSRLRPKALSSLNYYTGQLSDPMDPFEDLLSALPLPKPLLAHPPATHRPLVLMVDDDAFNFDMLEAAFDSDYELLFATDGQAGMTLASERVPDLILLDVMMPNIDGYEVCRRLKAQSRTGNIPVIFITGIGDMSAETKGLELGAVDYVTKPININAVRARAKNHLQLKWALEGLARAAATERNLRDDLLEVLELKNVGQKVH